MGKFVPTEAPSTSGGGRFVPDVAQPLADELDPNKYSPIQIDQIKSGKFTKAEIDEFNAQNLPEKINSIGPDLSGTPAAAALSSFVRGVPAAFGGVTGMAASAPLANALRPIPRIGPLLSGGVTLGSGVLGSILTGLGNEKLHPTSPEEAQLAQENPIANMAGGIGSNALFFKPGMALELVNRLKAASVGGGIQGVSELVNAPEGQTVGEGALGRIAESAGINALFNNPTKLSESILGPGSLAAAAAKKTKNSAIIDSLQNASTKGSLAETTAVANDIALAPPAQIGSAPNGRGPIPGALIEHLFGDISRQVPGEPKSAVESAAVFPESTLPIKSAADSAKVLERSPTPAELAATKSPATLGELIGQNVEYAGETGKLIRDEEGNFLIVRDVQGPGRAPFVEIANTGKDPSLVASDIGVTSKLAKEAANYSENVGPAIKYGDFQPNPRPVKGRFVPDNPVEAVKTPVAEQIPVKPTESPSKAVSEPVQSREEYLKELLDSKEITKAEYDAQIGKKPKGKGLGILSPSAMSIGEPIIGAAIGSQIGDTEEERKLNMKRGFMIGATVSFGAGKATQILRGTKSGLIDLGVVAHHGTPHKVDKFSSEKIGTGEGAQVYGHGLYFAENPKVASAYQESLSKDIIGGNNYKPGNYFLTEWQNVRGVDEYTGQPVMLTGEARVGSARNRNYPDENVPEVKVHYEGGKEDWLNISEARFPGQELTAKKIPKGTGGNQYQVDIDLKPEELLVWDKPLSQQSQEVRAKLKKAGLPDEFLNAKPGTMGDRTAEEAYQWIGRNEVAGSKQPFGDDGFPRFAQAASEALNSVGIKGVKYADQGSRWLPNASAERTNGGQWKVWDPRTRTSEVFPVRAEAEANIKEINAAIEAAKTHNYVVFDDSRIKITHENGKPVENPFSSGKLTSGVDPTELPAAIKHLTGLAKKGIEGLNDKLNERVAAVETAQANASTPEDVPPTPVLDNPNPNYQWKPWLSKIPGVGKALKKTIGIIDENIGAISPATMGGVRSREFDLSAKRTKWNGDTMPFGQMLRKALSPEEFQAIDLAIQNGQHDAVKQALALHPEGKEMIAEFDKAKASLGEQLYQSKIVGRDVGELTNYWPRRVHDYDGLRAELGRDEQGALDKAIMEKQKQLGRVLTNEEKGDVLNQSIALTLRGKPGFLKPRTIDQIKNNWLQYYEPFDVAMENHINRVSRDVVNRKYLGKAEFAAEEPLGGDLGKILTHELENNPSFRGKNGPLAQKTVLENLRDHLNEETAADNAIAELGNKLGRATNFLHLGDLSSGIAQFADIFNHIHNYGLKNSLKGTFDPLASKVGLTKDHNIKLADVGIHEGHAETADYSRSDSNSKGKRFVDSVVKNTVGLADKINKEAGLNSARHAFYEAVKDPNSNDFVKLNQKWSQRFPERWPEIIKDLQSKDFAEGRLNDNTRFFLYNELADIQPISMAQRAQLENAEPGARFLYALKRYWVKQLNVMRAQGYEKLKNPDTFWQGAKDLTSYAVIVGGGSAVAVGVLRDLLFGREPEPEDYALSGLTQLAGVTKYNIHQARQDGLPTAIMSFAFPLAADVKDLGEDIGLAARTVRGDMGIPSDIGEFMQQARTTKNIPYVGRELYNWFGRGRTQEDKRQAEKLKGKSQPNTLEEIEMLISPPAKKK